MGTTKHPSFGVHSTYCRFQGIVNILLRQNDLSSDKAYYRGQTSLNCATQYRRVGVVKILLGRGEVNPTSPVIRVKRHPHVLLL